MKYRQREKKSYHFKTIHHRCAVDNMNQRQIQSNTTSRLQGGSNMTGTDLYVNKPHCAAAVRP